MDFAMRSCQFCSEQILVDSVRCMHCLKERNGASAPTLIGKTKNTAVHLTTAVVTSLAVSIFLRHPSPPALVVAPPISEPSTATGDTVPNPSACATDSVSFEKTMARDAIKEFTETIKANPKDYSAYEERGWFEFKELGEGRKALSDLTSAIHLRPQWAQPYAERAWVYHFLGNDRKARSDAKNALARDRENMQAQNALEAIKDGPTPTR